MIRFLEDTSNALREAFQKFKQKNSKRVVTITELTPEGPKVVYTKSLYDEKKKSLTKEVHRPNVEYTTLPKSSKGDYLGAELND
jgi:CMP-N-acetylneuraminic acid synthetase